MQEIFEASRMVVALVFLFHASWLDYKTREVSNVVWIIFAPVAFALTFIELYLYDFSQISLYGLCFGLTAVFSIALFYSGGFGGADSKALMCLALALPFYPQKPFAPIIGENSPISQTFFPITVFSNSVLFAAASAVFMLAYNVIWHAKKRENIFEGTHRTESFWKKILVLITGYKMPIAKLKEKWHIYPLEDIEENTEGQLKRKLIILPKDEGRDEIIKRLDTAINAGEIQEKIWATPGLPMLIFVTAGLVTALLLGDIVWTCIRLLLR